MPAARSSSPINIKLLPKLAASAPACAAVYGLPFSTFVSVLVWNDTLRPNSGLAALPREGKLVRQAVPCSLRAPHLRMARARARAQHLSLNAYLEALIAAQLARTSDLIVYSQRK